MSGDAIETLKIPTLGDEAAYWFARYRAVSRALCRARGINPDELISDAGHEAWELAGHEAVIQDKADDALRAAKRTARRP